MSLFSPPSSPPRSHLPLYLPLYLGSVSTDEFVSNSYRPVSVFSDCFVESANGYPVFSLDDGDNNPCYANTLPHLSRAAKASRRDRVDEFWLNIGIHHFNGYTHPHAHTHTHTTHTQHTPLTHNTHHSHTHTPLTHNTHHSHTTHNTHTHTTHTQHTPLTHNTHHTHIHTHTHTHTHTSVSTLGGGVASQFRYEIVCTYFFIFQVRESCKTLSLCATCLNR